MQEKDVVIIGAGPHCLSLVVRLVCHHPWDECTFDVNGNHREFQIEKHFQRDECSPFDLNSISVIDPAGSWLHTWESNFETLQISHLRSTVLVHSDAFDSLSLLEYIQKNSITDLPNVFDTLKKKKSKRPKRRQCLNNTHNHFNEAQRKFFTVPTSQVFLDHAKWLIEKHELQNIVTKDFVEKVEYDTSNDTHPMRVTLASGTILLAKHVVYAGNQSTNNIPRWAPKEETPNIYHSSRVNLLNNSLSDKKKKFLIVGGGLSAVGAALVAALRGHSVTIASRSKLKVKQFDIPPIWMSPLRNSEFSKFYSLSFEERFQLIQSVRDGGSITPDAFHKLNSAIKKQQITLLELAEVISYEEIEDTFNVRMKTGKKTIVEEQFDVIVLATGKRYSIDENPILGPFKQKQYIKTYQGLPLLTSNLQWGEIPLYIMGAYSSLEVGPDALNLMGGQVSASRIVPSLASNGCAESEEEDDAHHSLTSIHMCNRFSSLIQ